MNFLSPNNQSESSLIKQKNELFETLHQFHRYVSC